MAKQSNIQPIAERNKQTYGLVHRQPYMDISVSRFVHWTCSPNSWNFFMKPTAKAKLKATLCQQNFSLDSAHTLLETGQTGKGLYICSQTFFFQTQSKFSQWDSVYIPLTFTCPLC